MTRFYSKPLSDTLVTPRLFKHYKTNFKNLFWQNNLLKKLFTPQWVYTRTLESQRPPACFHEHEIQPSTNNLQIYYSSNNSTTIDARAHPAKKPNRLINGWAFCLHHKHPAVPLKGAACLKYTFERGGSLSIPPSFVKQHHQKSPLRLERASYFYSVTITTRRFGSLPSL